MNKPLLRRDLLREEQRQIVDLIRSREAVMIVLPMAGGKTVSTLTAVLDHLDEFAVSRVLVIAPKRVAQSVWAQESRVWQHTRHLSVAVAMGTVKQREVALAKNAEVTVTNFENLVWLYKRYGAKRWPFDMLVVDESSAFKAGKQRTTTTKRKRVTGEIWRARFHEPERICDNSTFASDQEFDSKAAVVEWAREVRQTVGPFHTPMVAHYVGKRIETKVTQGGNITRFGAIARVRKKFKRVVLLTGTPAPNGVQDLWGQAYILDLGKRLGATRKEFEDRWFIKEQCGQTANIYKLKPRPGAEEEIMARLSDVMVSFPPPKDLPKPTFIPIRVKLPPAALAEYSRFKRTLWSEAHDVEAVSRGVLANKLLQFATGAMYREDRAVVQIHDAKLTALKDLVAEVNGEPLLVFYSFQFDLDAIRQAFPKAVVLSEDPDAVDKWNAGKIPILLAHPKSCAHGLNLQFGGHLACWYGFTWSLELYQQANARLPRPGQKWPVGIYQIIAEGTDEERLLEVLADRNSVQEDLTRAVQKLILD